jgi:hypothetical protein
MSAGDARLVLIVGVGRSGTSLISGLLSRLGFHIPQPEVDADETNPRGFGEPAWVVQFHTGLMRRLRVSVFDARPGAWEITGLAAREDGTRRVLGKWLREQLGEADAVVVKDPRIGWFLPLWTECAHELGVPAPTITMLRHPAEILASARKWYGEWQTDASRAGAWMNVMLETERATRGTPRAFISYEHLLADWVREVSRAGRVLDLPSLMGVTRDGFPQADELVDPSLRRSRAGWADLAVPALVREMAEAAWRELQRLAEPAGDEASVHTALDTLRESYAALYEEAEAISQSSVTAVKPRARKSAPPTLRARLARRVPARFRKPLRRAARSLHLSG